MKPWMWLRVQAGVLALFALGHTLGTADMRPTRGPAEAALFDAMRQYRFAVMGFQRSHWDFYHGFALLVSVSLAALAVMAWQLGSTAREAPGGAIAMAWTLEAAMVGVGVLSWMYFFTAPIVFAGIAVVVQSIVVVGLVRERRVPAA